MKRRALPVTFVRLVAAAMSWTILAWPNGASAQGSFHGFEPGADVSQRMAYRCPAPDAIGASSEPFDVMPDRDNAFRADYSAGNDLVDLAGVETELAVDLGSGNDVIIYRDVTSTIDLVAGAGDDTVILCDMNGVRAMIGLSAGFVQSDTDADVLIIDERVFADLPGDITRYLSVFFDPASDTIVIHAAPRKWDPSGQIRIGDLVIALTPPTGWVGDFNALPTVQFRPP